MRSDNVKKGVPTAPNRSLFYALGYTKEELERPLIGVVCSYNEIVPGHMNLDKIAEAVKAGVRAAGGTLPLSSFCPDYIRPVTVLSIGNIAKLPETVSGTCRARF